MSRKKMADEAHDLKYGAGYDKSVELVLDFF